MPLITPVNHRDFVSLAHNNDQPNFEYVRTCSEILLKHILWTRQVTMNVLNIYEQEYLSRRKHL